jgi:adenylate kinase
MDAGELVPDEIVIGMIRERLVDDAGRLVNDAFLLDGFPRSVPQADALGEMLDALGAPLDAVISLAVPSDELIERLLGRGRGDDTLETIRRRLEVYEEQTAPLIAYYRERGLLREVDGLGTMDAVHDAIVAHLPPPPQ